MWFCSLALNVSMNKSEESLFLSLMSIDFTTMHLHFDCFGSWINLLIFFLFHYVNFIQFTSVTQLCTTLCDPMDCSMPCLPVHYWLLKLAQTHVHPVGDAIQPSHPLLSPSPFAFNLSQHEGLFKWVSSSHQVAKVVELRFQHQSFQWIFRTDFFYFF